MRLCAFVAASTFILVPVAFAQQQSPAASDSTSQPSAQLRVAQTTEIPGATLSPGGYSIRVADRLQDRTIVQIEKDGSSSFTSLLAYPNPRLRGGTFTGPVTFVTGIKGRPTLRGYAFPGGPVVEFVYPKTDAVTLAKANSVRVMAVDPGSEGRVSLPNLTQTDMSEVTLWMLTPTPVDPKTAQPGIQAARYQAPNFSNAQSSAPEQSSAAAPPSYPAEARATSPASNSSKAGSASSAPVEVASNTRPPRLRPNVKQLPHTASNLPLIFLLGCVSLGLAASLTVRRRLLGL